jgi:hypothetical protein
MHCTNENRCFNILSIFVEIALVCAVECGGEIMGVSQYNGLSRLREGNITFS